MRKTSISIVSLLLLAGAIMFASTHFYPHQTNANPRLPTAPITPVATLHPVVSELFTDVNNERIQAGETPLVDDPRLDASAAAKCADEVAYNYHAHITPTGRTWQSFFVPEYQNKHIGENLAWGYTTSSKTVAGWMGSPSHRAAILDSTFAYVGYAVCGTDNGANLAVEHFKGL